MFLADMLPEIYTTYSIQRRSDRQCSPHLRIAKYKNRASSGQCLFVRNPLLSILDNGLEECQCHNREQALLGKVRGCVHRCSPILTHYVLCSILSARSSRSLTERRISHILSVCPDPIPAELPESGLTHMRISVEDVDYADLLLYLPAACRFIDQAIRNGGTVLVHDVQGLSRSATVVAAYCESSVPRVYPISHTLL